MYGHLDRYSKRSFNRFLGKLEMTHMSSEDKKEFRMKFKPLGDRILVRPLQAEETTKSGIVLPDTAKQKPEEGEVVAIGTGKYVGEQLVPLEVKVGQRVMFTKYGPTEIKIDGKELFVLSESDVLGIIE